MAVSADIARQDRGGGVDRGEAEIAHVPVFFGIGEGGHLGQAGGIILAAQTLEIQHRSVGIVAVALAGDEDLGQQAAWLVGIQATLGVLAADIIAPVVKVVGLGFDAEAPFPFRADGEQAVAIEVAAERLFPEGFAIAVKVGFVGEAALEIDCAGIEALAQIHADQRVHILRNHRRDGDVRIIRNGPVIGLFVEGAERGGEAGIGHKKARAAI